MVDNDCTCKKSELTPGTAEVYVVPAPHTGTIQYVKGTIICLTSINHKQKNRFFINNLFSRCV
jgi:hypothetical protein